MEFSRSMIQHPDFGAAPVNYESQSLSDSPDTQVAQTIDVMSRLVREDSPYMQADAVEAMQLGGGDPLTGVFEYVKGRMKFQQDEHTAREVPQSVGCPVVEVLIRPRDLSRLCKEQPNGVGDCDDFSMYCASLLACLGIPCSFATLAADDDMPNAYSHVYVVAYPNGVRVPMDCSHGERVGWEAPNRFGKLREWPVDGSNSIASWLVVAAIGVATWFAWKNWEELRTIA